MSIFKNFRIEPKYTEKRDFVRMQIDAPIYVTITTTGETFTGVCKNMSGNGVLFQSAQVLNIDTQLAISIGNNNNKFNKLDALIQVVWTEKDPLSNMFNIGTKILQLK